MNRQTTETHAPDSHAPDSVQRKLAQYAEGTMRAIVMGDRNGIIEWANNAWVRLTGYALTESIDKPIGSFVHELDLDPSLVRFVHASFTAGQVCEAIVPFTTPDGRELRIELRVEPLFDERGEVSDFIAIASDASSRIDSIESARSSADDTGRECIHLDDVTRLLCDDVRAHLGERSQLEIEVEIGLPQVESHGATLRELLRLAAIRATETLGDAWGTITVGTGILGAGRGPLFRGDPAGPLPEGRYAYVEIHDTGPELGAAGCEDTEPFQCAAEPGLTVEEAGSQLRAAGGELFVQVEPWTGTSVLVLLPVVGGALPVGSDA